MKLIFDLVGAALTARGEKRAEILANLAVAMEALDKANDAEDAAHVERTAETRAVIAAELAKTAPQPTILVNPATVIASETCPGCNGPMPCANTANSNGCAGTVYEGG